MHQIKNLWKFGLNWSSKLQEKFFMKKLVCFQSDSNIIVRNYLFLKNFVTSEGAISHNVVYYSQLSVAHYKVIFCANFSNYRTCPVPLKVEVDWWLVSYSWTNPRKKYLFLSTVAEGHELKTTLYIILCGCMSQGHRQLVLTRALVQSLGCVGLSAVSVECFREFGNEGL